MGGVPAMSAVSARSAACTSAAVAVSAIAGAPADGFHVALGDDSVWISGFLAIFAVTKYQPGCAEAAAGNTSAAAAARPATRARRCHDIVE
jgi:hypothetical protein